MLPVISANSGEVELATELAMRPHRCSAKGKKWTSRRSSRRTGLARDAVERPGELAEAWRSSSRQWRSEMERSEQVEV